MDTFQLMMRFFTKILLFISAITFLSGCTNLGINSASTSNREKNKSSLRYPQEEFENSVKKNYIKTKLMSQYAGWKGVRYKLGGSSKKGIDCSAFVQRTFYEQFGVVLPRSTTGQNRTGHQVRKSNLRVGDIVLFRLKSGRHVGIYLGKNKFIHASTSMGVTISNLNNPYWKRHYSQARRILGKLYADNIPTLKMREKVNRPSKNYRSS